MLKLFIVTNFLKLKNPIILVPRLPIMKINNPIVSAPKNFNQFPDSVPDSLANVNRCQLNLSGKSIIELISQNGEITRSDPPPLLVGKNTNKDKTAVGIDNFKIPNLFWNSSKKVTINKAIRANIPP